MLCLLCLGSSPASPTHRAHNSKLYKYTVGRLIPPNQIQLPQKTHSRLPTPIVSTPLRSYPPSSTQPRTFPLPSYSRNPCAAVQSSPTTSRRGAGCPPPTSGLIPKPTLSTLTPRTPLPLREVSSSASVPSCSVSSFQRTANGQWCV